MYKIIGMKKNHILFKIVSFIYIVGMYCKKKMQKISLIYTGIRTWYVAHHKRRTAFIDY